MEHHMNYKEELSRLRSAGLTTREIDLLVQFRRSYIANGMDFSPANLARLHFIRWLVEHGKLTDQLA